jgi:hypothetical protein
VWLLGGGEQPADGPDAWAGWSIKLFFCKTLIASQLAGASQFPDEGLFGDVIELGLQLNFLTG